jgi:Spy/CpxP family protein refolding chaperone
MLLSTLIVVEPLLSQPDPPDPFDEFGAGMATRREQMETLRIYKMTEFLELTPDQSARFFPMLKTFEEKVRRMQREQMQLMQEINQKTKSSSAAVSEVDVQKYLKNIAQVERDIIGEKEKFIGSLKSVLTPYQQLRYMIFENRFRHRLLKTLNPPPPMHN